MVSSLARDLGTARWGLKAACPRAVLLPVNSDRRVGFVSEQCNSHTAEEAGILARLKALVLECETQGPGGIIPKLRKLAQTPSATAGARLQLPGQENLPDPAKSRPVLEQAPAKAAGKGKTLQTRLSQELRVDVGWWPGRICGTSAFDKALCDGTEPTASLVVTTLSQLKCWRELAATHSLATKVALVCPEDQLKAVPPDLPATKKWVKTQDGVFKQVWAIPLGTELPSWGTEPQVVNCEAHLACRGPLY